MDTIILDKGKIDKLFDCETHQADVLIEVYKMVFPDWKTIKSVDGFPHIGTEGHEYFFKKFMVFDRVHHPEVLSGALWMNNGFSRDDTLAAFEVMPCTITRI